jgi:hypothetical protein
MNTVRRFCPAVEELERRLALSGPGGTMPPGMGQDDAYFNALLPAADATNVAVHNGSWTAASTWQNGLVPAAGAKVFIPMGISVVYDAGTSPNLAWIRDEGSLSFSDAHNESLLVETITVMAGARFDVGTASAPFSHQLTITFADNGPIDTMMDPQEMGRGLISAGHVAIYGKTKTPFVPLTVNPVAGATAIAANGTTNWQVGDRLLITGTSAFAHQDEEATIVSTYVQSGVKGGQSTRYFVLDHPLLYNHTAPSGFYAYVADETRTVTFTSQNTTDSTRFGHTMFMENNDVTINYAAFVNLGRTDKTRPIDDVVNFYKDGTTAPGGGTNIRGRYALHFHHDGTDPTMAAIQVVGNFVSGSPGWGYVNHDSNVNFSNNVSFNVVGAGFVTESGGEIGTFNHNLAVYERGAGTNALREDLQDWGFNGDGFSFQGGDVNVTNNIATGAAEAGFELTGIPMNMPGMGVATVPTSTLKDPSIAGGQPTMNAGWAPLLNFTGNQAFGSYAGWGSYVFRPRVTALGPNVIDHMTVWNIHDFAINPAYTDNLTIANARLVDTRGYNTAIETDLSRNLTVTNSDIRGFGYGIRPSSQGNATISGGFLQNGIDIYIGNADDNPNRTVTISNVTFGTLPGEVDLDYHLFITGWGLRNYLGPQGTVTLNGQNVFAPQQAANYIAFPTAASLPPGYPLQLVGETNQQLMDLYGLAAGGVIAPATATQVPGVSGLVGGTATALPALTLVSPDRASVSTPYTLSYIDLTGLTVVDPTPVTLNVGWNIITRVIGGRNRSFLVLGC